jgi:hypothetical protein
MREVHGCLEKVVNSRDFTGPSGKFEESGWRCRDSSGEMADFSRPIEQSRIGVQPHIGLRFLNDRQRRNG